MCKNQYKTTSLPSSFPFGRAGVGFKSGGNGTALDAVNEVGACPVRDKMLVKTMCPQVRALSRQGQNMPDNVAYLTDGTLSLAQGHPFFYPHFIPDGMQGERVIRNPGCIFTRLGD